jgi:hypothetical protein
MSVTNVTIPTTQSFLLVDTRTGPNKVLFLPTASTIQGRYLSIKDYYGNATNSSLTISTTGLDRIDQRGIRYTLASSFGSVMLLSDGLRSWNMLGLYEGGDTAIGGVAGPVSNGTVTATGGTVTTSGSYKIHSFTTVGTATFTLTSPASISAIVLVIAGGGAGGTDDGGGGGAGGVIYNTAFTITSGSYTVTVGNGGTTNGANGANSILSSLTAIGGGGGANSAGNGASGGSGGGVGWGASTPGSGTAGQGNTGGGGTSGPYYAAGGGGGAGGVGGTGSGIIPGNGGIGVTYTFAGTTYSVGGGGGGGLAVQNTNGTNSTASHGGGNGAGKGSTAPIAGTPNTGGGGGGANNEQATTGGAGGSGIVIIAYTTIFYNTWQYVRFTLVLTRGQYSTKEWQMSEFTLKYQGSPVSYTGATISPVVGGGEDNPNLIDGNLGNKAFNTSISFTIYRASGFLFNAYTWATANDVPNRDPVRWILDASQDNTNWTVLDNKSTADQTITTSRNTYVQDFTF